MQAGRIYYRFFKSGTYLAGTDGEPASFADFGAGAMFLPSGLAYFNGTPSTLVSAYSCLVFSFQLFDVNYLDYDGDGILNKDEFEWSKDDETGEWKKIPVVFSDTDGDGVPNYADVDDDGDGFLTKDEIRKVVNGLPSTNQYYTYDEMLDENGTVKEEFRCPDSTREIPVPKYMDDTCRGGVAN